MIEKLHILGAITCDRGNNGRECTIGPFFKVRCMQHRESFSWLDRTIGLGNASWFQILGISADLARIILSA